uniref:Enoyl-CoA hydratase 1, peroxisomal n=1 Tax=Ananas comosus var. bracteatus TaxID=296719 RepID=A0A6V7PPQ4_ANACO|nr:unnamed protein product [Ananas comosus var. bracteatus]
MVALAGAFRRLDVDDTVAAVVLVGRGRAFCSGVDLTAAEDVFKGDIKDPAADPVAAMVACRKPIVGAIAGFTVTAGFEIALACDLLVASRDAKFADPYAARPPLLTDLSYPCAAAPRQLQLPEAVAPRQPLRRRGRRFSPTPTTRGRVAPRRPLRPRPRRSSPTPALEAARLLADPCAAEAVSPRPPAPRPPAPR